MQKIASGSIAALALLLAACSNTTTQGDVSDTSSSSAVMMQDSSSSDAGVVLDISSQQAMQSSSDASQQAMQTSSAAQVADANGVNVITVDVQNFQFSPNMIVAKKGQKTQIKLVGVSGSHGFAVPQLGINVRVATGDTVTVDLPTDTAGTYNAFCSVPCGPGHRDMKATVVVE
ncbi:MAG TPA: cupredoxin domain-containing protein [Candidatus Peribacteraceae bacterium]|nr:cupredoxin domain-containing protein [Candidatus Peribacteraceae bacterium]